MWIVVDECARPELGEQSESFTAPDFAECSEPQLNTSIAFHRGPENGR